jgi:pyruvate/2-oxoglutarate dehydrogenase complex dihydrolipoamide acyltransferase (E2) component
MSAQRSLFGYRHVNQQTMARQWSLNMLPELPLLRVSRFIVWLVVGAYFLDDFSLVRFCRSCPRQELAQDLAQELAEEPARGLAEELVQEPAQELAQEQTKEQAQELARELAQELAQEQAHEPAQELARELAKELAQELAQEQEGCPLIHQLADACQQ